MASVHRLKPRYERVVLDDKEAVIRILSRLIGDSGHRMGYIAKRCGVCPATVSRIHCRETKQPQLRTLINLLSFFGWQLVMEEK